MAISGPPDSVARTLLYDAVMEWQWRKVGRKALVLRRVDAVEGRVRIGGEEWTARAYLDGESFPEGAHVEVVKIEGATALVVE